MKKTVLTSVLLAFAIGKNASADNAFAFRCQQGTVTQIGIFEKSQNGLRRLSGNVTFKAPNGSAQTILAFSGNVASIKSDADPLTHAPRFILKMASGATSKGYYGINNLDTLTVIKRNVDWVLSLSDSDGDTFWEADSCTKYGEITPDL